MTIAESQLSHVRVEEVMHTGILTTDPSTPLRTVARLMSAQRVHAVAVSDPAYTRRPMGFISSLDIARAVANDDDLTAGQAATTEVVVVSAERSIPDAAQLMADHSLAHLIVVDTVTGHPCGIISSLDITKAYAA